MNRQGNRVMQGKGSRLILFLLCLFLTVGTGCTKQPAAPTAPPPPAGSALEEQRGHVYLIAQLNIRDRGRYSQYVAGFMEILSRYGGRLLSVDESPDLIEGKWDFTRTVLLEFPSEAAVKSWYHSEDYQRLVQHRHASSDANIVVIKGR
jgi:uncharacterized protein (DUF1330 family)